MLTEKRKPAGGTAGFQMTTDALRIDVQEDGMNTRNLQVLRIRCQWPNISLPVARAVAELHFGGTA